MLPKTFPILSFVFRNTNEEIKKDTYSNLLRMSFDMGGNHEFYLGDAEQVLYEEINLVTNGGNYEWNVKEGFICFNAANNDTTFASCPTADNLGKSLTDPVLVINNAANPQGVCHLHYDNL